jgi:hypothetical protein
MELLFVKNEPDKVILRKGLRPKRVEVVHRSTNRVRDCYCDSARLGHEIHRLLAC